MVRKTTIYEAMKADLGREPTNAELKDRVCRIIASASRSSIAIERVDDAFDDAARGRRATSQREADGERQSAHHHRQSTLPG